MDVSSYNGTIDWVAVKNDGVSFAWLRAYGSIHTSGGDTEFVTNVTNAKANGIPTGGYYFATPNAPLNLKEARDQAQQFIDKLQTGYGVGQYGDLIPMLDYEDSTTNGGNPKMLSSQDAMLWINEFKGYFESISKTKLGLYSGIDFLQETYKTGFNESDMPLWIAAYESYGHTTIPDFYGWTRYVSWQYASLAAGTTGTVAGVTTGYCDMNRADAIPYAISLVESAPVTTITNVTKTRIGSQVGANVSTVTFHFDKDITEYSVNVTGVSADTGILAQKGRKDVATAKTLTVSQLKQQTVKDITQINALTDITADIDNTEMYSEGDNRVNIYGKDKKGRWTPYNQV